jgi:hypothetical protein
MARLAVIGHLGKVAGGHVDDAIADLAALDLGPVVIGLVESDLVVLGEDGVMCRNSAGGGASHSPRTLGVRLDDRAHCTFRVSDPARETPRSARPSVTRRSRRA